MPLLDSPYYLRAPTKSTSILRISLGGKFVFLIGSKISGTFVVGPFVVTCETELASLFCNKVNLVKC